MIVNLQFSWCGVVSKGLEPAFINAMPLVDMAWKALTMATDLVRGVGERPRLVRLTGINHRAVCRAGSWPELLGLMGPGIKWEVW